MKRLQKLLSIGFAVLLSVFLTLPSLSAVSASTGNELNEQTIDQAIDKASKAMLANGINSEWEAIGLAKAGKKVPAAYTNVLKEHIKSQVTDRLESGRVKITDIERLSIAAVAAGLDPTNIDGTNLIELIYNSMNRPNNADSMTLQGNNGPIFALIALDTKDFPVPDNAKWTRQKLINELLHTQNDDGSWSLYPGSTFVSIDIAAMAVIGLSPYKNQPKVKTALDKAIGWLSSIQKDNAGFDGGGFVGGITSEAASQVIIGLTAYGVNPASSTFTKNGVNVIEHLLSYQTDDGGFKHTMEGNQSNDMATEQALQALTAYKLYLNNKGSLYHFHRDTTKPSLSIEGIKDGDTVIRPDLTFTVTATDDIDGDISPAVTVNGQKAKEDKGSYHVRLKEGTNKIVFSAADASGNQASQTYNILYKPALQLDKETAVKAGETVTIAGVNTQIKLPGNLPDGTTLYVRQSAKKHKGLLAAGPQLHFEFHNKNGSIPSGDFSLSMKTTENADIAKTGIYYFNEQTNTWEYTDGFGQAKDGVITITVPHFSTYGVFTDTDGPSNLELTKKAVHETKITLGLDAADPSGIKDYQIKRNGKQIATVPGNIKEFTDNKTKPDTSYIYTVTATDQLGNQSQAKTITIQTPATATNTDNNQDQSINTNKNDDTGSLTEKQQKEDGETASNTIHKNTKHAANNDNKAANSKLPNTATNIGNFLLIGFILILIGGSLLYIRKKRAM